MGAPTGWVAPKVDWATDNAPTATHFNNIEGNIYAAELGARTIDQTVVPADNATTLRVYIDEVAHQLDAIIGKTNWYDTPDTTLKATSEKFTVSGVAFDHDTVPYSTQNYLDTPTMCMVQKFATLVPANSSLVLLRARYHIDKKTYRIIVFGDPSGIPGYPAINLLSHIGWLGADNSAGDNSQNDESPTTDNIVAWNGTGAPVLKTIYIGIWCTGNDTSVIKAGDGWTIDFGFETGVPTTTTTTTAGA